MAEESDLQLREGCWQQTRFKSPNGTLPFKWRRPRHSERKGGKDEMKRQKAGFI